MALQKLFIGECNFVHTISVLCITFYMFVLQDAWDSSDPQDDTIGFYIFDYELEFMT